MRDWKLIGNSQTIDFSIFTLSIELDESLCLGGSTECRLSAANQSALEDV